MCLRVSPCVSRGLLILRFRKHSVDDRALRSTLSQMSFKKDVALKPGSRVQVQRLCSLISRNLQYATSLLADLYRATKQHSEKTGPATVSSVQ